MANQIFSSTQTTPADKQQRIINYFVNCPDEQAKYQKIIELGSNLPEFPSEQKRAENIVSGCQSIVYLHCAQDEEGRLFFTAYSEALISAGLAALAIAAYSGLFPEEILQTPPRFAEEIGLAKSLTPGRSNGLLSMLTLIKQKSLQIYLNKSK